MEMKEIKSVELRERKAYVPAEVCIYEIAPQGIICQSLEIGPDFQPYNDGGSY